MRIFSRVTIGTVAMVLAILAAYGDGPKPIVGAVHPFWARQNPLSTLRVTAIHALVLTDHKLSVTAFASNEQYRVSLVATSRAYPVHSPNINERAFGIHTGIGDLTGYRYGSSAVTPAGLYLGPYRRVQTLPPDSVKLTGRLCANQWISHRHGALLTCRQKGWRLQMNQLLTVPSARDVVQVLNRTKLPTAHTHGVIVVAGGTDGAAMYPVCRVGSIDYRVFGRPESANTIEMAGSMHRVSHTATTAHAPNRPPSWTYNKFTNHGPNGSFTMSIPRQFRVQPPPTDHDGRTWTHGSATITAFSEINATHAQLLYPLNRRTVHVTYEAKGPHWRVASGIEGSTIVYAKVYLLGMDIFWLQLSYPKAEQSLYGPVVSRVANSFEPSTQP